MCFSLGGIKRLHQHICANSHTAENRIEIRACYQIASHEKYGAGGKKQKNQYLSFASTFHRTNLGRTFISRSLIFERKQNPASTRQAAVLFYCFSFTSSSIFVAIGSFLEQECSCLIIIGMQHHCCRRCALLSFTFFSNSF